MKISIHTCLFGKTDSIKAPAIINPRWGYVCATDRPQSWEAPGWLTLHVPPPPHPVWAARKFKIRSFQGTADFNIWVDAAFKLLVDPEDLVQSLGGADLALLRHPDRDNVLAEGRAIIRLKKAPSKLVLKQMMDYASDGDLRPQKELSSTGLIVARNNDTVRKFSQIWLDELLKYGHTRDQMSVDYAIAKAGANRAFLTGDYRNNPYAKWFNY